MTNTYTRETWVRCLQKLGLAAILAGSTTVAAQAQALNYSASNATNLAGTYTDLGTTGTAITTANTDDANSAAQSIGFTFTYNGLNFTQFVLNTNGVMRLGNAAPSVANLYAEYENGQLPGIDPISSASAADVNLLMPFNFDLESGSGGAEYRVTTTGTAPNQVCTIQWKNVRDKTGGSAAQYDNFSFQVKLYQTSNVVEFVYGAATPATTGTETARFPTVGIKGSGSATGQTVLGNKTQSGAAWSTTVFITGQYGTSTHNFRRSVGPDAGRTYRFTPAVLLAKDVAVLAVYTLGKIATPSALPQQIRAFVSNLGTTAQNGVVITLDITGANTLTQTVTVNLPVGTRGTVAFPALPATLTPGTNIIKVSVASDENDINNSATVTQLVTADRLSYIDQGQPANAGALSYGAVGGVLSVKYTVPNTVVLKDALISFAPIANNTTSFQVVVHDAAGTGGVPGNLIYSSPPQNRTAAGGDVTVALPALQLSGSFYVGVKELETPGVGILSQNEVPLRATTFYISANGSAPWTDLAATTFTRRLAIEVGLAPAPSCAAPTALAVTSVTPTTAVISFTDATTSGSYQLIYGPVGFQPATGGTTVTATGSPATITGLQPGTLYQVYVRTNCTGGGTSLLTGPLNFSTGCAATTVVAAFPYAENFDNLPVGQALPCGFTALDGNNDGTTWAVSKVNPNSGSSSIRYNGLTLSNVAANDWFFTPALTLAANTRYQVSFRYRGEGIANSPSSYTESLEVTSGSAPTVAAQTNVLYTNAAITNTSYALANGTSTPAVALLPAGAGTQYVGFRVKSAANQGILYLDDIAITATAVSANSEALLRAISIFPNPSTTGRFDLSIRGANAKGALDVVVTNTLGQRVYSGSARDNYTNKLDLTSLAPGIYYLQVRNGSEYTTSRVSIAK
ncbi:hypothetical protein BEN47_01205 [Hymenobacter lapidarius]|uniref:Fibronectin type-III domain-containing protein n=1 Tax=Hymenobacter lapidarius TaxID=1908237 RepID=A0A1G1T5V8_9BACT|nr:T9SS type A sorting domain-containing protein [Hymenobacter lapidarius]OGX86204.1 hypothetical protein BEN47_01205 [Hymenobacter lapidarius]